MDNNDQITMSRIAFERMQAKDELLSTIRALQPKLYQATIDRIRDQR